MENNRLTEQELTRINKLNQILELGFNPFLTNRKITNSIFELTQNYDSLSREELESQEIRVEIAGRLMLRRGRFHVIRQNGENFQLWIGENLESRQNQLVELLDIGDIIWTSGSVTKSNNGFLMLRVEEVDILTKALKPLPEKFHGLQNIEDKYRRRYLDLLFNKESRQTFETKTKIITYIRNFFDQRGYLEVTTPVLQPYLGGANAKPFRTHFNALKRDFVLRVATELPLKQLLVGDLNKVYEIGTIFRNEGVDSTHNPEFTSIEFYEAFVGLEEMMDYTEELIRGLIRSFGVDKSCDIPFRRLDFTQSVSEAIGQEVEELSDQQLEEVVKKHNIEILSYYKRGHLVAKLFEELVEDSLQKPTFIYNYPLEISPLARIKPQSPHLTERAELFIYGKEIANMFGELNDPIDQLRRFEMQLAEKEAGNDEANEISYDFLEALRYGMPPAGGCGIGIERLVMILTNLSSIRDVILFPQLKKKN